MPVARWLCVPDMLGEEGVAESDALRLRVPGVRTSNFTDHWYDHAPFSIADPRVVLGSLLGFDSPSWNQRIATTATAWDWWVSDAWHLLHRLRKGMVNDNRSKLSGLVEVDETHIGGPVKGKKGRGVAAGAQKSLVAGGVEVLVSTDAQGKRRERAGRLRLEPSADASGMALGAFLTQHVQSGSKVRTDAWRGYSESALAEYTYHVRVVGDPRQAARRFPHIHRVFSTLKAWLNGTHHGVEPQHLPSYWDEFVFCFNRRKTPMAAFQTLLGISAQKSPISLTELLSPESK